jgi:hypothetical protein
MVTSSYCASKILACLSVHLYAEHEWDSLPHVMLSSEVEWDPSVLDHDFKEDDNWGEGPEMESSFDNVGDYKHSVIVQHLEYFQRQDGDLLDDVIDQCVLDSQVSQGNPEPTFFDAMKQNKVRNQKAPAQNTRYEPDYDQLCPFFGWSAQTSSRRILITSRNMHVFLLVPYSIRRTRNLIQP